MLRFKDVIEQYSEQVFNHCLRMVKNKEDAEELTQDIFIKIYKGLSGFRGDSQLKTWIYRITVNTCITKINSKEYRIYKRETIKLQASLRDSSNNIEENLVNDEIKSNIEIALNCLFYEDRQILLLLYIEELSYKEIGEVLGLPIGTVCTKIFRARNRLKEILQKVFDYEM